MSKSVDELLVEWVALLNHRRGMAGAQTISITVEYGAIDLEGRYSIHFEDAPFEQIYSSFLQHVSTRIKEVERALATKGVKVDRSGQKAWVVDAAGGSETVGD